MLLRADVISALAVTVGIALAAQADFDSLRSPLSFASDSHAAVSFADQIMPILEARCTQCHSEEDAELGLKVDTYEGIMGGSDYGTVIEAGDPDGSLLLEMIIAGDMPEDGDPVPAEEIELLRMWIAEGALNN
jgi:uncharacterized membrane protein